MERPIRLPAELLDAIMSYLIPSYGVPDKPTLQSCSLACRSWVKPAQTCLFQSIEIAVNALSDQSTKCKRLLQVLQISPHIALYVRHLSITFNADILLDESLQALLQLLPTVRYLNIRPLRSSYRWRDLPHTFLVSLISLISNPMFQKLWIKGVMFTPSGGELTQLLRHCANTIQALTLADTWRSADEDVDVDDGDDDNATTDSATNPVDLTKLRELVAHGDLPAFGGAIKMPNLQFLERDIIGYTADEILVDPWVLETITSLSLDLDFNYRVKPEDIPSLQVYSELRWIHLNCWYQSDLRPFVRPFRLTPSSNFRHLEYLLLNVNAPLTSEFGSAWDASLWDDLTAPLVPLLSLGRFKTFLIILSYGGCVGRSDPASLGEIRIGRKRVKDFVAAVRAQLHSLDSKGALELRLWDSGDKNCMKGQYGSLDLLQRMRRIGYRL